MDSASHTRVLDAIEAIKHGKMVVMIDDEDRENEGDLVYAATFSTPELVNFMAKEARGLICTPITPAIAKRLDLDPMVRHNDSAHETAFTVSIDAASAATGISAAERSACIAQIASATSKPEDFVRPGHIFPLIAKEGGVLVRTGHTEGSVDLCRLAGVTPAAVICEIIREDGSMARRDDLRRFARRYDLPIVYIADLVAYRLAHEKLVEMVDETETVLRGTRALQTRFRDHLGRIHTAVSFYSIRPTSYVKFHNIGYDIDHILDDKRHEALESAIAYLKQHGGVLVFLDARMRTKEQIREYGIGAQILKLLGIEHIKLLASAREVTFVGLGGFGLDVTQTVTP